MNAIESLNLQFISVSRGDAYFKVSQVFKPCLAFSPSLYIFSYKHYLIVSYPTLLLIEGYQIPSPLHF